MEMEESTFLTLDYTTNNIIQAQKQKYRSMEQDREPRNKHMHIQSINLQQRSYEYKMNKNSLLNK